MSAFSWCCCLGRKRHLGYAMWIYKLKCGTFTHKTQRIQFKCCVGGPERSSSTGHLVKLSLVVSVGALTMLRHASCSTILSL